MPSLAAIQNHTFRGLSTHTTTLARAQARAFPFQLAQAQAFLSPLELAPCPPFQQAAILAPPNPSVRSPLASTTVSRPPSLKPLLRNFTLESVRNLSFHLSASRTRVRRRVCLSSRFPQVLVCPAVSPQRGPLLGPLGSLQEQEKDFRSLLRSPPSQRGRGPQHRLRSQLILKISRLGGSSGSSGWISGEMAGTRRRRMISWTIFLH
jgi:hypothetical protein